MPPIQAPPPAFPVTVFKAARRALPQLMLVTIAAGLAAFVAQSWITPRFQAEALLRVGEASNRAAAIADHIRGLSDPERIVAVAKEQDLQRWPDFSQPEKASALLAQLGLARQRSHGPGLNADERLLSQVLRRLNIAPGREGGTISVGLTASDPNRAAAFVNRLIGNYVKTLPAAAVPIEVSQWAAPPQWPVYPRKGAIAMVGMGVALLLGLLGIAAREAYRRIWGRPPGRSQQQDPIAEDFHGTAARFVNLDSVQAASEKLSGLAMMDHGFRTIVAGEAPGTDPTVEALQLATELSRAGRQVVLVRWALAGGDVLDVRARPGVQGLNDLMQGTATFEDIIKRLPDCQVHGIAAGAPATSRAAVLDPDRLNLVLDTLDEVYDHIVVVAEHTDACTLFVTLEGRFDACVSVSDDSKMDAPAAGLDSFLGFEVTDIDIIHLHRPRRPAPRRMRMAAARVA